MAYTRLQPVSKQLTIVIGLTVVGFMAFGLALSFYRNILFDQTLQDMENENRRIVGGIEHGYSDLEYYRSTQYKDKFAKENLGKLNPGEKLLIITRDASDRLPSTQTGATTERQDAAYFELLQQMPVIEHWMLYLFQRDRLEELREKL